MNKKNNLNIEELINNDSCFDLQFRKDVRRERINSPTYYRWKAQFIITQNKNNISVLKKVKEKMGCGQIYKTKEQARFSVQNISSLYDIVIPFLKKIKLKEKKSRDFALWHRAVKIIWQNKRIAIAKWKKSDLLSLIQIQKSSLKYKKRTKKQKWLKIAQMFTKNIS